MKHVPILTSPFKFEYCIIFQLSVGAIVVDLTCTKAVNADATFATTKHYIISYSQSPYLHTKLTNIMTVQKKI